MTRTYIPDASDAPRELTIRFPAIEYALMVRLRDEMWPGQPIEMVARKLVQDELIRLGLLALPKVNRSKRAGRE